VDVAAVTALHVQEGKLVKAGDLLIELDSSGPDAERDKATGDVVVASVQAARSRALILAVNTLTRPRLPTMEAVSTEAHAAAQLHLDGQYADFRARLERIDSEIARYSQALPLATQRAADYKILAADHDVSQHAWQEKEQARIDLAGQLNNARTERAALITQTKKEAMTPLPKAPKLLLPANRMRVARMPQSFAATDSTGGRYCAAIECAHSGRGSAGGATPDADRTPSASRRSRCLSGKQRCRLCPGRATGCDQDRCI